MRNGGPEPGAREAGAEEQAAAEGAAAATEIDVKERGRAGPPVSEDSYQNRYDLDASCQDQEMARCGSR